MANKRALPQADSSGLQAFNAIVQRVRQELAELVPELLHEGFTPQEVESALGIALQELGGLEEYVRS